VLSIAFIVLYKILFLEYARYSSYNAREVETMSLSYAKLWKLLIDKRMKRTDLIALAGLSSNTIARLGKDEVVDMQSLLKICDSLSCKLSDILEYTPEEERKRWQDADGHMYAKVPTDIYNLDTKALKRKVAETAKGKKA
jgi:DNA-binding Xre family transcriptional regulator